MVVDVVLHMGLELSGAGTLACIRYGCTNPAHNHRFFLRFLAHNKWARWGTQLTIALFVAIMTVKLIG